MENVEMSKKVWQRIYDNVRYHADRDSDPTKDYHDCKVLGIRTVDKKGQLLLQGKTECPNCQSKSTGESSIENLPQMPWKSRGEKFTAYDNRANDQEYNCARCGKKVRAWLIVRAGLIFGYRCARRVALDIVDGTPEEEIWTDVKEAQEARKRHERKHVPLLSEIERNGEKKLPSPEQMKKDVYKEIGVEYKEEGLPSPEQMVKEIKKELEKINGDKK
jgi:DNA-directed RNA polymerase subunit RPC12/RpoP